MSDDNERKFRPKVGRPRGQARSRALPYSKRVLEAVARASRRGARVAPGPKKTSGRYNKQGRGARVAASLPRAYGGWYNDGGMRFRGRRVIVKARVVKLRGSQSRAAYAHLRYLQRDGVEHDGSHGQLYSSFEDETDGAKFLERSENDRHQFRFIVAPEDAARLSDLQAYTRTLIRQIEQDLETSLDWVAVDHHNTSHPHSHIVVRGITGEGRTLNIAGDYIAHGIRYRACDLMDRTLGPQSELEVQQKLQSEVEQDRLTRLDRILREAADDDGVLNLAAAIEQAKLAGADRYMLIGRLKKLERMALAEEIELGKWKLQASTERILREIGEQGDIIKTMHRALTKEGVVRGTDQYLIHGRSVGREPIIGRVVGKGLAENELSDHVRLVVDGIDGRVHYVETSATDQIARVRTGDLVELTAAGRTPKAADRNIFEMAAGSFGEYRPSEHLMLTRETMNVPGGDYEGYVEAHVRRLEALRRVGVVERIDADRWKIPQDFIPRAAQYEGGQQRQVAVRVLSPFSLDVMATADAATWLDRAMVVQLPPSLKDSGFGHDVQKALARRMQWLIEQGAASEVDGHIRFRRNLLAYLQEREVRSAGEELSRGRNVPFRLASDGARVEGRFTGSVLLKSGRFAVVENSREFTLVPWRPVIEHERGKQISGIVRGGDISWDLGRDRSRGLGIS